MAETMKYVKFLDGKGLSPVRGWEWPLPSANGEPGAWTAQADPQICVSGWHFTDTDHLWQHIDETAYELEPGDQVVPGMGKYATNTARLVRELPLNQPHEILADLLKYLVASIDAVERGLVSLGATEDTLTRIHQHLLPDRHDLDLLREVVVVLRSGASQPDMLRLASKLYDANVRYGKASSGRVIDSSGEPVAVQFDSRDFLFLSRLQSWAGLMAVLSRLFRSQWGDTNRNTFVTDAATFELELLETHINSYILLITDPAKVEINEGTKTTKVLALHAWEEHSRAMLSRVLARRLFPNETFTVSTTYQPHHALRLYI